MVHIAVRRPFEAVTLLLPLIPIPLVLALERWAVSKYEFSRGGAMLFRGAYVVSFLGSCYATLALIAVFWG